MYAYERAEAVDHRDYGQKPQEIATIQASFLELAPVVAKAPRPRARHVTRHSESTVRQLTFADIDEAWR